MILKDRSPSLNSSISEEDFQQRPTQEEENSDHSSIFFLRIDYSSDEDLTDDEIVDQKNDSQGYSADEDITDEECNFETIGSSFFYDDQSSQNINISNILHSLIVSELESLSNLQSSDEKFVSALQNFCNFCTNPKMAIKLKYIKNDDQQITCFPNENRPFHITGQFLNKGPDFQTFEKTPHDVIEKLCNLKAFLIFEQNSENARKVLSNTIPFLEQKDNSPKANDMIEKIISSGVEQSKIFNTQSMQR